MHVGQTPMQSFAPRESNSCGRMYRCALVLIMCFRFDALGRCERVWRVVCIGILRLAVTGRSKPSPRRYITGMRSVSAKAKSTNYACPFLCALLAASLRVGELKTKKVHVPFSDISSHTFTVRPSGSLTA